MTTKTPQSTLQQTLATLNKTLSSSTATRASPLLSVLYTPHVHLGITLVTASTTHEAAHSFSDAVAALSDARLLGASFVEHALQTVRYVPGRIDGAFVGTVGLDDRVVRYSRNVVLVWKGSWRVCEDRFVLFP